MDINNKITAVFVPVRSERCFIPVLFQPFPLFITIDTLAPPLHDLKSVQNVKLTAFWNFMILDLWDNYLIWAVMTCFTDVTIVSAGFSGYFLLFVTLVPPFILMIYILVTKLCIYGSQSLPHLGYGHTQAGRKMPRWKYMQRSVNLWITPGWRRSRWRVSQAKKGNLGDGWMAI